MNFTKKNTLTGWFVFFIAFTTYYLTVEPTASYWDCSEYIATSAKLQVGHPPGAPLFQMMGAFFSSFASGPENVAFWVNMMSVMASAFTILFMFWSLTILLSNIVSKHKELDSNNQIAILGSAAIGSLSFAFTDSFWFNAVEAEVYAFSTFFTAIVVWLILHWSEKADEEGHERYILIIAYMIGLILGLFYAILIVSHQTNSCYLFIK